ncbi:hypothetical protein [Mucilaginibacter celer]|uniref:Uncharacterized protein n=1 Tax=Mucilaginibacter celer TaxID=2305508 RepID=A0A494VL93_9SPHI|nr:hypothetical protein [Mucilaginibacter celer]AYL95284.1 hypothetical protein HYN43_008240 [Mucilaginibacter celer]
MSDQKIYLTMLRMLKDGYQGNNGEQELYLLEELRRTDDIDEFKAIAGVIGATGGLFCIPTLMAFSVEQGSPKVMPAIFAITDIHSRVEKTDAPEIHNLFTPAWWQPRWKGSFPAFISYVFCITEMIRSVPEHRHETVDTIGEQLVKEFALNLFPFETFRELRLSTPGCDSESDIRKLVSEVDGDMLMISMFKEHNIHKSKETLYEENILNMRCDYLLTRLNFKLEYQLFRYLLKTAEILNAPEQH